MRIRHVAAIVFAGLLVGGCFSDAASKGGGGGPVTDTLSGNNAPPTLPSGVGVFYARFEAVNSVGASSGILPYPTDLYFNGTTDGTLNIPNLTVNAAHLAGLNALDGFSTIAPANARFSRPIKAASIGAATVRMIEVTIDTATTATVGVRRLLTYGTDYTARVAATVDSGGTTLEIVPLKPLTPSTGATHVGYLIILTNGLQDTSNNVATPDADYVAIKNALPTCSSLTGSLNGICQLTGAHLAIAGAVGVPAANVVLTFSYTTQATRDTMGYAAAMVQPTAIVAPFIGITLAGLNPALPPIANVHAGTLRIPFYLSPTAPLSGSWHGAPFTLVPGATPTTFLTRFNPVPVKQADLDIPLLVTVPNAAAGWPTKPAAGWPVVIFQHGLTRDRTDAAGIAAAYAQQGFVVAAIDATLHGITNTANPLYQAGRERTFDLDVINNATNAFVPDGVIDGSGTWWANLQSALTTRDNFRQAEIDLVQLAASLPGLDLDGVAGGDIDPARIHYVGQSLGGILGTVASALPSTIKSAYLNVPGGGVILMIPSSPYLSARFNPSLAAINPMLVPGLTLYDQFWRDAQTVGDSADPVNYIAAAAAARPIVLTQVIGDAVVPNSATQRLISATPFTKASAAGLTPVAAGSPVWVNFTAGSHGSLLDFANLAVTIEMQTHAASLVATGGAAFQIVNTGLLEP